MSPNQIRVGVLLSVLGSFLILGGLSAEAQPKFDASQVVCTNESQLMICDLDGDGFKDLVLLNKLDLSIFFQDATHGFTRDPQLIYHLDPRPCLVWTARLGKPSESLLIMTSDGVNELSFTNRTSPPISQQIIKQSTIIPDTAEETNAINLPLSAATGGEWPLLLVPAIDGLQVWRHYPEWRQTQVINHAMDVNLRPSVADPGYTASQDLDLSVSDVNGDGRDDLMVRRRLGGGTNTYQLYLQQTNGLFGREPTMTYAEKQEPFAWHCWTDLNRDGRVDLVKGVWLNEPSFIPGVPSAKVLVSTYLADAAGNIPNLPQQIFRKNDWLSSVPVVDVDGDGFPDLVLGYNHLESKESASKEITARQIDYSLRFFFFHPGDGYPKAADCQLDVTIHLDFSEGPLDWTLPQNFSRCVRIGGDFTGNGKADLLVRDHSENISVYSFISRSEGFSAKPDVRFDCPEPIEEWQVLDLNHDGISDLIVKLANQKGLRLFISHK